DRTQRALERLLDDLRERVLLREEALGGAAHTLGGARDLEVHRGLDGQLDEVLVDALDGDADLALLERDEEALLQDRPDEDAAADDDALAGIRFGGLAAGAAAHDDHRGVRRNALDASRYEAEDR